MPRLLFQNLHNTLGPGSRFGRAGRNGKKSSLIFLSIQVEFGVSQVPVPCEPQISISRVPPLSGLGLCF